jgi:DNA-binding LacI/PurR family transcriptional regulator
MQQLLGVGVDAVFAASDIMAVAPCARCTMPGFPFPRRCLVGFDDLPMNTPTI